MKERKKISNMKIYMMTNSNIMSIITKILKKKMKSHNMKKGTKKKRSMKKKMRKFIIFIIKIKI
jgi:hypothetical protein